jgi:hypothetical protein
MNVKTLKESPDKLNECVSLIEEAFRYDDQYSYKEDFSLLLQEENYANCYFLEEDGEVVSTLFTLPRVLEYKDVDIPVLFLGGISVKDEKRGAGLFRTLLETILLFNPNFAFYMLWSDLSQLYEKFSFYEFGLIEEIDLRDQENNLKEFEPTDTGVFVDSYLHLKDKYIVPKRRDIDWYNLLFDCRSIKILEDEGKHCYFVNKGMDLQGICHEHHPMDAPPIAGFINWRLTDKPDPKNPLRYMGFMRMGNVDLIDKLIRYTSGERLQVMGHEEGMVKVLFDDNPYELSEKDFIQGLFGPGRIEEWRELVPLILIHGYDSI